MAIEVTDVLFKDYVDDGPVPADNFVVSKAGSVEPTALQDSEILVQLLYLSVDPYMRNQMKNAKASNIWAPAVIKPSCLVEGSQMF